MPGRQGGSVRGKRAGVLSLCSPSAPPLLPLCFPPAPPLLPRSHPAPQPSWLAPERQTDGWHSGAPHLRRCPAHWAGEHVLWRLEHLGPSASKPATSESSCDVSILYYTMYYILYTIYYILYTLCHMPYTIYYVLLWYCTLACACTCFLHVCVLHESSDAYGLRSRFVSSTAKETLVASAVGSS